MIGSTDSHTSLATADQDNFFGKHSGAEPKAENDDKVVDADFTEVDEGDKKAS
jgi:hypothetical protein